MNPTPVLFVCEDNQRGISVETPRRWIRDFFSRLEHLRYFEASGDVDSVWDTTALAIQTCRTTRQPTFLRFRCFASGATRAGRGERVLSQEQIEAAEDTARVRQRAAAGGLAASPATCVIVSSTRERVRAA